MNTANLQLEGLCLAIAAVNRALVENGVLSQSQVDVALRSAEEAAVSEEVHDHLSAANRQAICFPIKVLQIANASEAAEPMPFSRLARAVAENNVR